MLGNSYAPEIFTGLPTAIESPLKRICEETLEDLDAFKTVLQDFGCKVIQPKVDHSIRLVDDPRRYRRAPLVPRDFQLILGNRAYTWDQDHPAIADCLNEYSKVIKLPPMYVDGSPTSANCFMIGKDVYHEPFVPKKMLSIYDEMFKHHRRNIVDIDSSHTDGCMHPLKPGVMLSICDVPSYASSYPGWDICYLEGESWAKVKGWNNLKMKNAGKFWLGGQENNDEFTFFVNTWLDDWVGYVEESVFDVNVVMLDEYHCCVSNPHNEIVNAFLKKHKIEPVYVPWRHRWFWDGGLHCITLDLYREGIQQDYFPDRADQTIDHRDKQKDVGRTG